MSLWNEIAASRIAVGKMWGPFTNLDMMARSWQVFEVPFDFNSASVNLGSPGTTTFDITLMFPEDQDIDVTFDEDMRLWVSVSFLLSNAGTLSSTTLEFTDDGAGGSSGVVLTAGSPAWRYVTKSYTTVPTGEVTEEMTLTLASGGTSGAAARTFGTRGPDCAIYYSW